MNSGQTNKPENLIVAAIDMAEDIRDPLEGLVERTAANPGAPFAPDVLEQLAAMKKGDRAAFEALRAELKHAGCRMAALDDALAEANGNTGGRPTQADILIELAKSAELFHAPDGTGFADLNINGHRETWPIRSKGFRRWLARSYFEARHGAPNSEALQSALNVIEAKAHFDGPECIVPVRVGALDGHLYLDLCDMTWRAVEIDATGWRVIDNPPLRFRRTSGMRPLPLPVSGGSVEMLRPFLNVQSDSHFVLAVAWALAALRDRGPYPLIVLSGEHGTAKSTFSGVLRALIDPNTAPLRALPREDRDLFIAATNGHVLAFDNVSGLPAWISDTLCRLATGGGFAVRQLYTDQDEILFDAVRPVILNGIEDIITRPDLADRAIFLSLEPIPEDRRRPEAELWADFECKRPHILGALLDAVAQGLQMLPRTRLEQLPRMADFALWVKACEAALWTADTFMAAYVGNRDDAIGMAVEGDVVTAAIRDMMAHRADIWVGTSSELLALLTTAVGETVSRSRSWPRTPEALRGRIRRAATVLRQIGIGVVFGGTGRARRNITIFPPTVDAGEKPPPPSPLPTTNKINDLDVPVGVSVAECQPDQPSQANCGDSQLAAQAATETATDTTKSSNLQDGAGSDGGDGFCPTKFGKTEREASLSSANVAFIYDDAFTNMMPRKAKPILAQHDDVHSGDVGGVVPLGGRAQVGPPAAAVPLPRSKFLSIAKRFIADDIITADVNAPRLAFDTESNGLVATATKLHCLIVADLGTGQIADYGPDRIAEGLEHLSRAAYICGHHILGHELPLLERLYSWRPAPNCTVEDTLVLSRMLLPNIQELDDQATAMGDPPMGRHHGKHSIAAWGLRLGKCKPHEDITDWSKWTPEMQERCVGDVQITTLLWQFLNADAYSREARELEHRIAPLCARIEQDGVPFNVTKAGKLRDEMVARKAALGAQLTRQFGSWLAPAAKPFTPARDDKARGYIAGAPFTRLQCITFNPSSRRHISKVLHDRGWTPNERTPSGQPKIDDQAIAGIASILPEFSGLADYLVIERRLGQLADGDQAWLKHVDRGGRIHGAMNPMGTPHSRASHYNPNVAQVPKPTSPWGKECRELFEAPEGWLIVGADQAGLQARAFAHYLAERDDGAYAKALLKGDPHWDTVLALGLQPEGTARDKQSDLHTILREVGAKQFYYAFLFGAGPLRIGSIIFDALHAAVQKGTASDVFYHRFFKSEQPDKEALRRVGEQALGRFESRTPGLRQLRHALEEQARRNGWLLGLDGRRVPVRSMHSVLNFMVTSAEAVICKRWLAATYDELRATFRYGWDGDVVIVLWVHDEIACCCRVEIADRVGEILVRNAKQAGVHYQFRVPLDSAYKIGRSWAEVH
jgi:DNA polymerase I-like protein with 3'-5' exonuclease and polymerase domains